MQSVLTIDLSQSPVELTVSTVEGNVIEVLEHREFDAPKLCSHGLRELDTFSMNGNYAKNVAVETAPTGGDTLESAELLHVEEITEELDRFNTALRELQHGYTSSVVLVPSHDFIALNVELPFGNPREINRIIDLEVQDLVPFEVEEFLIQYHTLGPARGTDTSAYDVHVGLLPKRIVRNILTMCRLVGVEPAILVPASSVVSAVYYIAANYFKPDSAVLHQTAGGCALAVSVNGVLRTERMVKRPDVATLTEEGSQKALLTDIKLTIAACERRYQRRIEHVYVLGNDYRTSMIQQTLGRPVESFTIDDVVKVATKPTGIGSLAAVFARDEDPVPALSNFRAREFAYSARFEEVLAAFKRVVPYFGVAAVTTVIAVIVIFIAREYRIGAGERELVASIQSIITEFNVSADKTVINALREKEVALSTELGALGSPSQQTPLDVLAEISKDIPPIADLSVQTVKITSSRATVDGVAPLVSAIDQVENALKKNTKTYSKVSAQQGAPTGNTPTGQRGYRFSMELLLKQ